MKGQRVTDITWECEDKPPYGWKILARGEGETTLILETDQGSWVTAFFRTQELKQMLRLGSSNKDRAKKSKDDH
jgi:hypothetical protein